MSDPHTDSLKNTTSVTCILTVTNKMGIHARPAAMIVRTVNKYPSTEVSVTKDLQTINAKSIMGLMMLAANYGTQLQFHLQGPNASSLAEELKSLFNRNFEEN